MASSSEEEKKQIATRVSSVIKTIYTKRGYAIYKRHYSSRTLKSTREDLLMSPFTMNDFNSKPQSFPIYLESPQKLYLPKYYGFEKYGSPDSIKINRGLPIDVKFEGQMKPLQLEIIKTFLDTCILTDDFNPQDLINKSNGGIISVGCGVGKCMKIDTPILMYDGTIKMVQDVKVGDQLMGDDSTPRNVITLARGREIMYRVVPTKGEPYIVNKSHILSLKASTHINNKLPKGSIVDISIEDYLKLPKSYHGRGGPLLGYRVGVTFPHKDIDFDPYIVGYWLGDGTSRTTGFSTQDATVLYGIRKILKEKYPNLYIVYRSQYDYSITSIKTGHRCNDFLNCLKDNNLIQNKHIPYIYKCNSREIQLQVLAGIIDSDGSYKPGGYDIIQKNEKLLDDIIYIARSLGFAAYKLKCNKSCMYKGNKITGTYYRTCIHGKGLEEIPVKIPRKKAEPRRQIKDVLATRIHLEELEEDDYYGFELDGNRRYLLGDFTVTHNTVMSIYLMSKLLRKTIVIVHKEFLMNQWKTRIKQFLPTARVGTIQGKTIDIDDKDIVLCMLQSLSMKEYDNDIFNDFGFVVVDECHHISAEVFSRSLPKINSFYSLGLSATPKRTDGLSKVFHLYLGPMVYRLEKREDKKIRVNVIHYNDYDEHYCKEELSIIGKPCLPKMITNIVNHEPRNLMIETLVHKLVTMNEEEPRKILLLSDRRDHLEDLYRRCVKFTTVGFYVGGMKQKDLEQSEQQQVILGTYPMSSEGLDIGDLNTVIFTTPKSSIEQSIGRIIRKQHAITPLAFDIVDGFSSFPRQYKKREQVYKKLEYDVFQLRIKVNNYTSSSNPFSMFLDYPYTQVDFSRKKRCKKDDDSESEEEEEKKENINDRLQNNCLIEDE